MSINEQKYIKIKTEGIINLSEIAEEFSLSLSELVTFHNQHCSLHELLQVSLPKYVECSYLPVENVLERDQKLLKSTILDLPWGNAEKTYGVFRR